MNLYQMGDFTLNSGAKSKWKLELDALAEEDWITLAYMVTVMVGPFASVEGVPRGGLKLASLLQSYISSVEDTLDAHGPLRHLIVDDVLTTGGSMNRLRELRISEQVSMPGSFTQIIGAVIYARGPLPYWVKAVHPMPECFWLSNLKE